MAKQNFNLQDYETVDQRIQRFYRDNPKGRITSDLVRLDGDVNATRWIVRGAVYRDSENELPAGVGYASEVDGGPGANRFAALENCETSAIGRALANAGYSGNKRTTREEMLKVVVPDLLARVKKATSKDETRELWNEANRQGVLDRLEKAILAKNEVPARDATA